VVEEPAEECQSTRWPRKGITEGAQQAIEIFQANPEKFYEFDKDTQKEIVTALIAGGLLGPVFEIPAGGSGLHAVPRGAGTAEALRGAAQHRQRHRQWRQQEGAAATQKLADEYSRAIATEAQYAQDDIADACQFGPDTPRYKPSEDMARFRAEVIVSATPVPRRQFRWLVATGRDQSPSIRRLDSARNSAQTLNDSAPHSASILESFPVIPVEPVCDHA
jgi:hypothetical protein